MSKNIFNSVQYPKVGSNTFDLSHDVKMSFQMGRLYPTVILDCIPGDHFRLNTETMLRFAPLISPVMHRVNVTTHFFFVPNRILWPNWEKWITGDLDVEPPYMDRTHYSPESGSTIYEPKSLADYMGIPTDVEMRVERIDALPVAAIQKIYAEYYRDQNLQDENIWGYKGLTDGKNTWCTGFVDAPCPSRSWMHDYFTASLPFAQKGDAVMLPLGTFSDVEVYSKFGTQAGWQATLADPLAAPLTTSGNIAQSGAPSPTQGLYVTGNASQRINLDPRGSLAAKTSDLEAEAADINTLRRAFRLQEWLEKNARGGTRYIENIMAHFGVRSSDARLNRPEYLGGSRQKMVISEVLSTAETDVPVGQMAGHGISVGGGREFSYRCEEHGWIIGLLNVQPVTAYQQGLEKKFSRRDRLDYAWPTFAHIGEQEVLNKEIYIGTPTYNEETFGYVPRYAEYRFMNSRVTGEMKTSLSHWHLGRIFSSPPQLNAQFIQANPSTRIFAVQDGADHIYGHIYNSIRALRKLPKFGTPSF